MAHSKTVAALIVLAAGMPALAQMGTFSTTRAFNGTADVNYLPEGSGAQEYFLGFDWDAASSNLELGDPFGISSAFANINTTAGRMGLALGAELTAGTFASQNFFRFDVNRPTTVAPGQSYQATVNAIGQGGANFWNMNATGPEATVYADLITAGRVTGRFGGTVAGIEYDTGNLELLDLNDDQGNQRRTRLATLGPGTNFQLPTLPFVTLQLQLPEAHESSDVNWSFDQATGRFRGRQTDDNAFIALNTDLDEILASVAGANYSFGDTFGVSPFGANIDVGGVQGSVDLVSVDLVAGLKLRRDYEFSIPTLTYDAKLVNSSGLELGDVMVTGLDQIDPLIDPDVRFDFDVPASVVDGETIFILMEVDAQARLEAITSIVGSLDIAVGLLSAELRIAGFQLFGGSLIDDIPNINLLETSPFEIARGQTELTAENFSNIQILVPMTVVPAPGVAGLLALAGLVASRRRR